MNTKQNLRIIYSCYIFCLFFYGVLILAIESSNSIIALIILPLNLFGLLKLMAITPPSDAVVEEILGVDLWNEYRESLVKKTEDTGDGIENNRLVFRTIAHRAAGLDAPENSISALKCCHKKGCKFVEIDLSLTRDGVPIVFHDKTLDRMVGVPGDVEDFLWEDLKNFNLVFQPDLDKNRTFSDEKIALFDEFIDLCVDLGIRVFIDIKDKREEVVKIILETYKRHPVLYKTSLVSSFNPLIIYKIRKSDPKIACSLAWRPQFFSRKTYNPVVPGSKRYSLFFKHIGSVLLDNVSTWLIFNVIYYLLGLSAILIHKDAASPGTISMWQKRNIRVIAWTVNSKIEKDYFGQILHIPYMTDSLEYNHINFKDDSILRQ